MYQDANPPIANRRKMLALVIVTHPAYLPHLDSIVRSVAQQIRALDEIVIVADGGAVVEPPKPLADCELTVIQGDWRNPQMARNAGLSAVTSKWAVYCDGDNIPAEFLLSELRREVERAEDNVAIVYPGTVLRVTPDTHAEKVFVMPEWAEARAMEVSFADTSSAWRVQALRSRGGWFMPSGMLDDYTTALRIVSAGWRARRAAGAVSVLRQHENRRSLNIHMIPETLWHARRHAILTLFAGRKAPFDPLMAWYEKAELPPITELVWLDNSGSHRFNSMLWREAELLQRIRPEIKGVHILRVSAKPHKLDFFGIHNHVAALYNLAIQSVHADVLVTIEDDVIPPRDAVRRLCDPIQPWCRVAGVSGIYACRSNPAVAVAAIDKERWTRMPRIDALPENKVLPIGMTGGGCSAWHMGTLRRFLPIHTSVDPILGWDGNLCARINAADFKLRLHTGIRCEHLCGTA